MTLRNLLVVVLLAAGFVGCNRHPALPNTPEGTLEKYVQTAFEVSSLDDKKKLEELSIGDAKDYLTNLSNDDFKKHFMETKLQFVSLKAKDRRETDSGEVSLVYELNYQDRAGTTPPTVHTNKKIAYLMKDDKGDWKIKATKNMKSFIEKKEDLVITPDMTDKDVAADQK